MVPSLFRSAYHQSQTALIGLSLNQNLHTMGLLLTPTFCNQKGQVWIAENTCLKMLNQQNMNVDKQFKIPLVKKTDLRDERPMNLPGRILTTLGRDKASIWEGSTLWEQDPDIFGTQPRATNH